MALSKWKKDVLKSTKKIREKIGVTEYRFKQCKTELQVLASEHITVLVRAMLERGLLSKVKFDFGYDYLMSSGGFDIVARHGMQRSKKEKMAFKELRWILTVTPVVLGLRLPELSLVRGKRDREDTTLVKLKNTHHTANERCSLWFYDVRAYQSFRKNYYLDVNVSGVYQTKEILAGRMKSLAKLEKMLKG